MNKTCENCINRTGKKCETMNAPFEDYSCFVTKEKRIKTENEIIRYAIKNGTRDAYINGKRQLKKIQSR